MTIELELVVASANPDKVAEIEAILREVAGDAITLVPRPASVGEVVEDGDTLEANARLKAVAITDATGRPSVADDTGFEVDALGGAPGVHAARFAGEDMTYADNVAKVLSELARVGVTESSARRARFRTVALVRFPDGREVIAEGSVDGTVVDAPRGSGTFGYDPVFAPDDGDGRTFAEMAAAEKHAISHRGRAFRALAAQLVDKEPLARGETDRSGGSPPPRW
jgi:XTP/dITP diphosphohydrolase